MNIFYLILSAALITPFFSPIGFYTIYLNVIKKKYKKVKQNYPIKTEILFSHLLMQTVIIYFIAALQWILYLLLCDTTASFILIYYVVPLYKWFSYYLCSTYPEYKRRKLPKKLITLDITFNILLSIIVIVSYFFI